MEYALLCLTSFAICGLGALLPFVNTEVYLIGAAALVPRALWPPLVVAGTVGAMAGKVLLYYAGRGMVKLPWRRAQRGLASMQERMARALAADITRCGWRFGSLAPGASSTRRGGM